MSPLRSSAGPAVCTNGTSSSAATICASEVLPSPGGPASSRWSSASPRAAQASIATASCSRSVSWPTNSASRRGRSERSSSSSATRYGVWMRVAVLAHPLTPRSCASRSAAAISSSGVSRLGVAQQLLGLAGRVAELDQAFARQRPGLLPRRGGRGSARPPARSGGSCAPTFSRSSTMIRSAVRLPIPGTAWKRAASPGGERGEQLARAACREHGERDLGPDRLDRQQHQEQVALLLGVEAVQRQGVVADDQVGVQRHLLADRRARGAASPPRRPPGSRRCSQRITTWSERRTATSPRSSAITRRAPQRSRAIPDGQRAASGARLAWQMATASASAAWSGRGVLGQAQQRLRPSARPGPCPRGRCRRRRP